MTTYSCNDRCNRGLVQGALLEKDLVSKEPFQNFIAWIEEAFTRKEMNRPNAMCLVTVSKDGIPSARMVLCRGYGKCGFKFFTSPTTRKCKEMEENPNVAASFFWEVLNRSVRVEGKIEKIPWDYHQNTAEEKKELSCKSNRVGYIIRPTSMEFWQGRESRLNDRIKFRKLKKGEKPDGKLLHQGEDGWVYERLSP